jgi:glycosyltransferase involved in cell wall biosynthesis
VFSDARHNPKQMAGDVLTTAMPQGQPRTFAGVTVLQIVPALSPGDKGRMALGTAHALVRAGGRAIVAGEDGQLVDELKRLGGEWLPLTSETVNPIRVRLNAGLLARFAAAEQVDLIHARNAGGARSARIATSRGRIALVTDLPDRSSAWGQRALSRGDRVIADSFFHARPMIKRDHLAPERLSIIPRPIDLARFDPIKVPYDRVLTMRRAWDIPLRNRIVLVPGSISPRNGQLNLVKAARIITDNGGAGFTFVLAGDDRRYPRATRRFLRNAGAEGLETLFRLVGPASDLPLAYATSDLVVVPFLAPPLDGRGVAAAQAMARPVIATEVGSLPESIGAPPGTPFEQRTGWIVPPGQPAELAHAILNALRLDPPTYRAHASRARAFAIGKFSPQAAVAATLEVYASLLRERRPSSSA